MRATALGAACAAVFNVLLPGAAGAEDARDHQAPLSAWDAGVVDRAVAAAAERLREPECQALLDDFADGQGHPLRRRLDELGLHPSDYLRTIAFREGSSQRGCRSEYVLMVAYPGRSTVYVCAAAGRSITRLAVTSSRGHDLAEHAIIHEMLHTLGLRENPPTSHQITQQVRRRCARVARRAGR